MSPIQTSGGVTGVLGVIGGPKPSRQQQSGGQSFEQALQTQLLDQSGVKLSAHAQKRLSERNVTLSADDTARIGAAVDRVQTKGADKSLVLMDDLALVVSARNRVVITAMDAAGARDGVFTGIDSAVIA